MTTSTTPTTPPDLFRELTEVLERCGPDATQHDRAFAGIMTCLWRGVDTKRHIISALQQVGFNPRHIAMVLDPKKGPFRNSDYWRIDATGRHCPVSDGESKRA